MRARNRGRIPPINAEWLRVDSKSTARHNSSPSGVARTLGLLPPLQELERSSRTGMREGLREVQYWASTHAHDETSTAIAFGAARLALRDRVDCSIRIGSRVPADAHGGRISEPSTASSPPRPLCGWLTGAEDCRGRRRRTVSLPQTRSRGRPAFSEPPKLGKHNVCNGLVRAAAGRCNPYVVPPARP